MKKLNKDIKRRAEILNIPADCLKGGTRRFDGASVEQIELLIKENFLSKYNCQNSSPTAEEFLDFMKQYPSAKAHGYVVSPERDDYRVTIEGLEMVAESEEEIDAFYDFCRHASDLSVNKKKLHAYSWWD